MNYLALIPARGGSKGILQKNVRLLNGKPLIEWTIEATRAVKRLNRTFVSTDCDEIAEIARSAGAETPFIRPADIADDHATALDVITHCLAWLDDHEGWRPDAVLYLQPTSPLRQAQDIEKSLDLLEQDPNIDTIVSVVQVPHNMTPDSLMTLEKGRLSFSIPPAQENFRRQEKPVFYARNGPAILLSRTRVYENGSLYGDAIAPLIMSLLASIDIDTKEELYLAEKLMS